MNTSDSYPISYSNNHTTLTQRFLQLLEPIAELHGAWKLLEETDDLCLMEINKHEPDGYDIKVQVKRDEVNLQAGSGLHLSYLFSESMDKDDFIHKVVGIVRDMLAPEMRLREISVDGTPSSWYLERYIDGEWEEEATTVQHAWKRSGLMKKTEVIYVNKRITVG